jgi:hypothetical protein
VQVTVVVPTGKLEPEDGEQVGPEVTATLSVAFTKNVTGIPEVLLVFIVIFQSPARTGGVVSVEPSTTAVTIKLAVPTFPAASVAEHVTIVVPIGNVTF